MLYRLNALTETNGSFHKILAKAITLNRTVPSRLLAENINCTLNLESPLRARSSVARIALVAYLLHAYVHSDDSSSAGDRDERLQQLRAFPPDEVVTAQRELLNFKYIQTRRKSFSVKVYLL